MFTGLVEGTGTVGALDRHSQGGRLLIQTGPMTSELTLGDSVAVNGCCLTVTQLDTAAGTAAFDLLEQTLRITNLGDLQAGDLVNLERAMRAGDRLGGHFVQGHVDVTGVVRDYSQHGPDHRFEVALPPGDHPPILPKGSICLDGISLTAAEVSADSVTCWIIPHTHEATNLQRRAPGQRVNIEFDMLGKYVQTLLEARLGGESAPA